MTWNNRVMGAGMGAVGLGYEGLTIDEFCARVVDLQMSTVVDVRLNALSRKRGFSKNGLRAALAEVGVAYLHFPVLGNPRENRAGFALPGSRAGDAARAHYKASIATAVGTAAIAEIAELAAATVIGVMCFESDQHECHRELVIDQVDATLDEILQLARR